MAATRSSEQVLSTRSRRDATGLAGRPEQVLRGATVTAGEIAAFVFDVDGVLADTAGLHAAAWRRLAGEENVPVDEGLCDAVRGLSREASLRRVLAGREVDAPRAAEMMERKNRYYLELVGRLGPSDALPGGSELLERLRARGLRLAVASASRNARTVLERIGLRERFDVIIDGNDEARSEWGLHRYLLAAAGLRLSPRRCVVVDDSPAGVATAREAGMRTVGVGDPGRLCAATLTIPSLEAADADALLSGLAGRPESAMPPR
jgi:kojibiose phosphorylase